MNLQTIQKNMYKKYWTHANHHWLKARELATLSILVYFAFGEFLCYCKCIKCTKRDNKEWGIAKHICESPTLDVWYSFCNSHHCLVCLCFLWSTFVLVQGNQKLKIKFLAIHYFRKSDIFAVTALFSLLFFYHLHIGKTFILNINIRHVLTDTEKLAAFQDIEMLKTQCVMLLHHETRYHTPYSWQYQRMTCQNMLQIFNRHICLVPNIEWLIYLSMREEDCCL